MTLIGVHAQGGIPNENDKQLSNDSETSNTFSIDTAKAVAEAYYKNTVFSVISMEIVSQAKNEISFSVCVSKGGVVQEPIVSQLAILEFVHATVLDLPERRC